MPRPAAFGKQPVGAKRANSRCTTGDADAERRERTWTWTDGTDVVTRMVCAYGRAEAMASTTARGLARARAIVGGGSMKDSGVEGATSRRRGRGGLGGGARVKGAVGVFVFGAALVKGAFGQTYVDYVRIDRVRDSRIGRCLLS
jgi:hypothetical protein